MRHTRRLRRLAALASVFTVVTAGGQALAADHAEAPGAAADPAADITDFYGWHTADGGVVFVVNVAGLAAPAVGQTGKYDRDVIYGIHLDTNADNTADTSIWVRFGQKPDGSWGVQVSGIPGTTAPVSGDVETALEGGGAKVFAGLRDDPFFFDLQGFQTTLATGTISFDPTRDAFAGMNVTSIVVEFPASAIGATTFQTWAETRRIVGG